MPGEANRDNTQRAAADFMTSAAIVDAHASHVHDYCSALLGGGEEAVGATQATFVGASSLFGYLADRARLRPWLFALARRECLSREPGRAVLAQISIPRSVGPFSSPTDHSEPGAAQRRPTGLGLPALSPEREMLDLICRHDISPAELPGILGIRVPAAALPDPTAKACAELAGVPLASLPATVWQGTASMLLDPDLRPEREAVAARIGPLNPDGFPAQSAARPHAAVGHRSARLIGMVLVPAAAGLAIVLYLGKAPAPQRPTRGPTFPSTGEPRPSGCPNASELPRAPIGVLFPTPHRPLLRPILPSATPSSLPSPVHPVPKPSGPHPSLGPTATASRSVGSPPPSASPSPSRSASPSPSRSPTPTPTPPPSTSPAPG